jgi:hypothetical protein
MDFRIDPEIQSFLPKLTPEEIATLSSLIEAGKYVDPLLVLNINGDRILGDGYHRLEICQQTGIPYATREIEMPSREAAIQWVIDNQLGRRNLTDERRAYYRGKEYLNKKQQFIGQSVSDGQNVHPGEPVSKTLSKKHGVNEKTIRRDAEFAKAVDAIGDSDPLQKQAILSGESGQTKQQVIEGKPLLCARCQRTGPARDCQACAEVRAKASRRSSDKPKPAPSGQVPFDIGALYADFGKVTRALDDLYRAYGLLNKRGAMVRDGAYEHMTRLLSDFLEAFKTRYQELSKEEPPEP